MKMESEYRVLLITVVLALVVRVVGLTLNLSLLDQYFVLIIALISTVFLLLEAFQKRGK